ncbi:unnamed protein product [Darwinula stevensoni]|uniref:EGF-like domain-containing protein n=1 Tax=Darwinula stevensoni TaxID=69355 RepID=A0A7R8XA04_9CRUS|nr:unnamed protein product [Darwinula stevensoni]CAG0883094.1 unnamed protein product [Darwinula stevensoni]
MTEACSSRSTPRPRPSTSPTVRPNITFQTYACPPAYAAWYCLNGATCFTVKIGQSLLYNCECADGFMGQRCEFKDLDGSYLPSRDRVMLETASIAGGATIAVVLVVIICVALYIYFGRNHGTKLSERVELGLDAIDGPRGRPSSFHRPFSSITRYSMHPSHHGTLLSVPEPGRGDSDQGGSNPVLASLPSSRD